MTSTSNSLRQLFLPSSWQWPLVLLSYCVLFQAYFALWNPGLLTRTMSLDVAGILGMIIVGVTGFFGWKAREPVMMDGAIVAFLFVTYYYFMYDPSDTLPFSWETKHLPLYMFLLGPTLAFASAAVGRLLRLWQLQKAGIQD